MIGFDCYCSTTYSYRLEVNKDVVEYVENYIEEYDSKFFQTHDHFMPADIEEIIESDEKWNVLVDDYYPLNVLVRDAIKDYCYNLCERYLSDENEEYTELYCFENLKSWRER